MQFGEIGAVVDRRIVEARQYQQLPGDSQDERYQVSAPFHIDTKMTPAYLYRS
jgi:hypothetical protein